MTDATARAAFKDFSAGFDPASDNWNDMDAEAFFVKGFTTARSTISEQEKRIAELERELKQAQESNEFFQREAYEEHQQRQAAEEERDAAVRAANDMSGDVSQLGATLTSERQRREEAEAMLQLVIEEWNSQGRLVDTFTSDQMNAVIDNATFTLERHK